MKKLLLKSISILVLIGGVVFFTYFNNTKLVNLVVDDYYSDLKDSLKDKGYLDNLLVISTKRLKFENIFFERFSVSAKNSKHLCGEAIDFLVLDVNSDHKIDSVDVDIVYKILNEEIIKNKGGIGTYKKQNRITRQMIHIDCRGVEARWNL